MAGALSNLLVQAAFAPLFDDYQLFEYVGERERLWKDLESPMRRLLAGVFSDVSAIFKAKTGFPLDEALKALKDEQQQRALITKLHPPHKRLKSKRSYFPTVQVANPANPPLLPAEARLPGTAVCVEGCLMHSSVLFHYYPQARPQLADASAWLMTDGPPHLLASGRFTGELLLLNFETPGAALIDGHRPFWTDIGWFPFARVTGYFKAPSAPGFRRCRSPSSSTGLPRPTSSEATRSNPGFAPSSPRARSPSF